MYEGMLVASCEWESKPRPKPSTKHFAHHLAHIRLKKLFAQQSISDLSRVMIPFSSVYPALP